MRHLHRRTGHCRCAAAGHSRRRLHRNRNRRRRSLAGLLQRQRLGFPERGGPSGGKGSAAAPALCVRAGRFSRRRPAVSRRLIGLGPGKIRRTGRRAGGCGRPTVEILGKAGKTDEPSAGSLRGLLDDSRLSHEHIATIHSSTISPLSTAKRQTELQHQVPNLFYL